MTKFENLSSILSFDDVCLLFEDNKIILAHKIVLSAGSPVLYSLLKDSDTSQNSKISMPSFDYITMTRIISFLYSGEAFLDSKEQMDLFIEYSDILGLKAFSNADNHPVHTLGSILDLEAPINLGIANILETEGKKKENKCLKDNLSREDAIDFLIVGGETAIGEEADNVYREDEDEPNVLIKVELDHNDGNLSDPVKFNRKKDKQRERHTKTKTNEKGEQCIKTGTKLSECPLCSYKPVWHGDLKRHKAAEHDGLRYKCNKCDSEFRAKVNLRRHILGRHEGVNYKCSKCSYSTFVKTALKAHMKARHEGKRFQCTECPDKFLFNSSLKKHTQVKHLGIRYNCQYCLTTFKRSQNFKRHTQTVHGGLLL